MKRFLLSATLFFLAGASINAADIYVSTAGNDSAFGSLEAPYKTLKKAIESAKAGTTIYLREGTYRPQANEIMLHGAESVYDCIYNLSTKGTADKPFTISGYNDEKVIIDCSDVKTEARMICFYMKADYWKLKNLDIVGIQVTQTGHTQSINVALFGGNHCVVENVRMHDGMGIGLYATRGSDNLVLNCDAYNNYDPVSENGAGGNCDGFGFHLNNVKYTGNVIRGCRAWRNSDDGFDLINNRAQVIIEYCWAWENGYDANRVSRGDGTGFKSGGYGMGATVSEDIVAPRNIVRNCLAWANKQQGFYANHHLGGLDFINNTAYANKRNFNMVNRKSHSEAIDVDGYGHHLYRNIAYKPTLSGADCVNIDLNSSTLSDNTFHSSVSISDKDFESLDSKQLYQARKEDGSLPYITFLRLKPTSSIYPLNYGYQFDHNDSSGVESIEKIVDNSSVWYDIQGHAVENPHKGIFIHKGRKFILP